MYIKNTIRLEILEYLSEYNIYVTISDGGELLYIMEDDICGILTNVILSMSVNINDINKKIDIDDNYTCVKYGNNNY